MLSPHGQRVTLTKFNNIQVKSIAQRNLHKNPQSIIPCVIFP